MSTTTYGGTLDVSATARVPLARLIKVELRKMWDTRAGIWLLAAVVGITALVVTIFLINANAADRTFMNLMGATGTPQGFLLPVLGILLVTQEWSQRTGMVTFTLEPHRGRVIGVKIVAALLFGLAAILIAMGVAALGAVLGGGSDPWANFAIADLGKFALLQVSGVLQGLAYGLLFLSSAGAIVTYFVAPGVFTIISHLWGALRSSAPWVSLSEAHTPLFSGGDMSGQQWAQLGVASLIWVILPFLLGLVRVLRAEVK